MQMPFPTIFFLKSKPENPGVKLNTKLCLLAEYQWGIYTFTHTHRENTSFHMLGFFPSVHIRQGSSSLKPGAWYSILASHGCSRNPNIWAMGISRKLGALTQCATIATPSGDSEMYYLLVTLPSLCHSLTPLFMFYTIASQSISMEYSENHKEV